MNAYTIGRLAGMQKQALSTKGWVRFLNAIKKQRQNPTLRRQLRRAGSQRKLRSLSFDHEDALRSLGRAAEQGGSLAGPKAMMARRALERQLGFVNEAARGASIAPRATSYADILRRRNPAQRAYRGTDPVRERIQRDRHLQLYDYKLPERHSEPFTTAHPELHRLPFDTVFITGEPQVGLTFAAHRSDKHNIAPILKELAVPKASYRGGQLQAGPQYMSNPFPTATPRIRGRARNSPYYEMLVPPAAAKPTRAWRLFETNKGMKPVAIRPESLKKWEAVLDRPDIDLTMNQASGLLGM